MRRVAAISLVAHQSHRTASNKTVVIVTNSIINIIQYENFELAENLRKAGGYAKSTRVIVDEHITHGVLDANRDGTWEQYAPGPATNRNACVSLYSYVSQTIT